jgi:hypothetical protein
MKAGYAQPITVGESLFGRRFQGIEIPGWRFWPSVLRTGLCDAWRRWPGLGQPLKNWA